MRTILAIDCPSIYHRIVKATGKEVGVSPQFFKSVDKMLDLFEPTDVAFCFDDGISYRKRKFPKYKSQNRDSHSGRYVGEVIEFALRDAGVPNVIRQRGMEADDLLAAIALDYASPQRQIVLATGDHDLYQCIGPHVRLYDVGRKRIETEMTIRSRYGIQKSDIREWWIQYKSILGCKSDNIPGVKGLSDKSVRAYLAGNCKSESLRTISLIEFNWKQIQDNRDLVELPFPGCKVKLKIGAWSTDSWKALLSHV
jgi:DNA polymerase-1